MEYWFFRAQVLASQRTIAIGTIYHRDEQFY